MNLKEILKQMDVDIATNKSTKANQLKCDLISQNYEIDFNKDIYDVTDDDLYQIGRSIILSEIKEKPFSYIDFIQFMKSDINEILNQKGLKSLK